MRLVLVLFLCGAALRGQIGQQAVVNTPVSGGAGPSGPLLSHAIADGVNGNVTTPAISTIGATVLLLAISSAGLPGSPFTDSAGNTWTRLAELPIGGGTTVSAVYIVDSPVTSATHTVSWTGGPGSYQTMFFVAFEGPHFNFRGGYNASATYSVGDVAGDNINGLDYMSVTGTTDQPSTHPADWTLADNGAGSSGTSGTTQQGGAITPVRSASVLVSLLTDEQFPSDGSSVSVGSGLTIIDQYAYAVSGTYGGALAYLSPSGTSALNPTWTFPAGGASVLNVLLY